MQSKDAIIRKKVMELIGEKIKNGKEFSQDEVCFDIIFSVEN